MSQIYPICSLQGDRFSPGLAERRTGVSFAIKNEAGEIGTTGRYRGQPIPYGSADLRPLDDPARPSALPAEEYLLDLLTSHIDEFRACGATDIVLHLDVSYQGQCNLEFNPEFLAKLAKLQIHFTISCYEAENGENGN